jgi:hypothetical protein
LSTSSLKLKIINFLAYCGSKLKKRDYSVTMVIFLLQKRRRFFPPNDVKYNLKKRKPTVCLGLTAQKVSGQKSLRISATTLVSLMNSLTVVCKALGIGAYRNEFNMCRFGRILTMTAPSQDQLKTDLASSGDSHSTQRNALPLTLIILI